MIQNGKHGVAPSAKVFPKEFQLLENISLRALKISQIIFLKHRSWQTTSIVCKNVFLHAKLLRRLFQGYLLKYSDKVIFVNLHTCFSLSSSVLKKEEKGR